MNDDHLRREALWQQMRERMGRVAIALPNILSPEERDRIYAEERWPLTRGMDLASGPDQTVEVAYDGKRIIDFNELPREPDDPNASFVYDETGEHDCGCGLRDKCPARGWPYGDDDNAISD
jgi:hypothetical protein